VLIGRVVPPLHIAQSPASLARLRYAFLLRASSQKRFQRSPASSCLKLSPSMQNDNSDNSIYFESIAL
jgi:hypothetical protein